MYLYMNLRRYREVRELAISFYCSITQITVASIQFIPAFYQRSDTASE